MRLTTCCNVVAVAAFIASFAAAAYGCWLLSLIAAGVASLALRVGDNDLTELKKYVDGGKYHED